MADPVIAGIEQDAARVVQFTEAQFAALLAAVKPGAPQVGIVGKAIAEVESIGRTAVADVKAFPWGHILTFILSTGASVGVHVMHLFGL